MKRLDGMAALVTGGESGIGAAVALRFHQEGASVLAVGVQSELLQRLSAETGIETTLCDVTDQKAVTFAVERARALTGRLDIVLNAAGIMQADDVGTIQDAVWEKLLAVNLTGTMRICRAAIPHLLSAGAGSIVNISSVAAFNGAAGMATYGTSKAGLIAFTRALANEYGQYRIRANCLCPGWVRTPMSDQEMEEVARARGGTADDAFATLTERIALRRIGTPEEIASCALFLASQEAAFVTGAVLVADGGSRVPAAARSV